MLVLPHNCQIPCSRFVGMWKRSVFPYKTFTKWRMVMRMQPLNLWTFEPVNGYELSQIDRVWKNPGSPAKNKEMIVDLHTIDAFLFYSERHLVPTPAFLNSPISDKPDLTFFGYLNEQGAGLEWPFFAHGQVPSLIWNIIVLETSGRRQIFMNNKCPSLSQCLIYCCLCLCKILRKGLIQQNMDINGIQQILIGKRCQPDPMPLK